jgi:solute carrier family 25 iron transporter 28/37
MDHSDDFEFEWEERDESTPFKVHMVAGSIAGISEHVALLPLDNLKTHLQTKHTKLSSAFRDISSTGLSTFYRGSSIIALGCIPAHAIYFLNYEFMKAKITNHENIDIFGNMAVGGLAIVFHDLIMTPCDMIKQRSQLASNISSMSIIRSVFRTEGIFAFWRSFPINFVGNLPNSMITVSANENLKKIVKARVKELNMFHYFGCAATAGIISSIITTPLDNIKTRLNVQLSFVEHLTKIKENIVPKAKKSTIAQMINERLFGTSPVLKREFSQNYINLPNCKCNPLSPKNIARSDLIKYPNALCALKIIHKEEGYGGFFKGLSMRMVNQSLSAAISWSIYELFKKRLMSTKLAH